MAQSFGAASELQSAHISLVDYYYGDDAQGLPQLVRMFDGPSFRSLRTNIRLDFTELFAFRAIHSLDIEFGEHNDELGRILSRSSPLKTLIIRDFYPASLPGAKHIEASTITSLAVSFSTPFYYRHYQGTLGGFETLSDMFAFPNLEHLEIVGGFTEELCNSGSVTVPEEWEAPLFPHLRTLRLEDVGFSPHGLALIQSFSRGIADLRLIYTTGNHCLSEQYHGDTPWPALCSLTVETCDNRVADSKWLRLFLAKRASLGTHLTLALSPWLAHIPLPTGLRPEIYWLYDGPSPALIDGIGRTWNGDFYIDAYDMRPKDFEYVQRPESPPCCCCLEWDRELEIDEDLRRVDEEISEALKLSGELVRTRGMWRELRRRRYQHFKTEKRRFRVGRKRERCDLAEDFSFT
ncbi:hypothetical protein MVEN_01971800 [Mycena venus]|uniref:Uncharacterized protein n=1 Tax=Mycena venus TaxID=2733690 RepID=A0A8H6XEB1_9AGAR|nr:hypothetical protein MVEN_01971800 [Mycena venus]